MPSNKELFFRHLGQTSDAPIGIEIDHAEGIYLYDTTGKDYIDLVSGVSVSNLGHRHPAIVKAVKDQLDKYMHLMVYGELIQQPQVQFAKLLSDLLPGSLESVYLVNSGSEANEGALKLAKRYTGREEIIACRNAYHGGTHGTLSLYSDEQLKNAFRPLLPHVRFIDFNNESDLKKITTQTACVMLEPVQGEGGVILPENNYLQKLRKRCNETGTLLIFDEIQTGFGRTGDYFAFQTYNVIPDIFTIAKAMGGGMPIGGFVSSQEIMNTLTHNPVLGHITTFGGHPVSAAAAFANLQFLKENRLTTIEQVSTKAELFKKHLQGHPEVQSIRHSGLLMAVELQSSEKLYRLMDLFKEHGIISDWFLYNDFSFRISPPITISKEEIEETCSRIIKCLNYL